MRDNRPTVDPARRGGRRMPAISLHQPWASFIAAGVKPYETRDWAPRETLIGQRIAIQAAKKPVNAEDRAWAADHGIPDLPLGSVLCTALLRGVYRCGRADPDLLRMQRVVEVRGTSPPLLAIAPDEYGDYHPGRWAWHLTDIEIFNPPIPARGAQGLWWWAAGQ